MGGGKVLFNSEDEALVGIKRLTVTDPLHVSIWSLTQKSSSPHKRTLLALASFTAFTALHLPAWSRRP